jgi:fructokinase
MTADELGRALSFACRCAAFTCTRMGADPPRSGDVAWPA